MPILFWLILVVWIIGIVVCFIYGGRAAPITSLMLGLIAILGVYLLNLNVWVGVVMLAIAAAIVWIIQTSGFTRT